MTVDNVTDTIVFRSHVNQVPVLTLQLGDVVVISPIENCRAKLKLEVRSVTARTRQALVTALTAPLTL